jgi:lipopolysaccharide biosynthesis protein
LIAFKKRLIAINLPQFHPIPENDLWWGKGFTEWTNVSKAKPLYKGHYQPHVPGNLGYYDLRLEEARIAQAELAKQFGISGFCYYHYWFNGKRLLHEPLDAILKSGKPDFPFMYCWANENWNRRWDGNEEEVLIKQEYSHADDIEHIHFLCKNVFSDSRYIRIGKKPFFAIYRPELFPDINATIELWRSEARKFGIELYLSYVQSFKSRFPPEEKGFDASIDFEPDFYTSLSGVKPGYGELILEKMGVTKSPFKNNRVIDYAEYADSRIKISNVLYKRYPAITPMWDNTARRKTGAFILKDSTPDIYGAWLKVVLDKFRPYSPEENFIFINAWNEWAEGNHLEPDLKWGTQYLEATKKALESNGS